MAEFDEYPVVRIEVTREFVQMMFGESHEIICMQGLSKDYKCIGVIQSPNNGSFFFVLVNENHPNYSEGMAAFQITPAYKKVDSIDKAEVMKALNELPSTGYPSLTPTAWEHVRNYFIHKLKL